MTHRAIKGSIRSITMWASALLLTLSNIAPLIPDFLKSIDLQAHTIQIVGTSAAILMAFLRSITTMSLSDKTLPPVIAPPNSPTDTH